MNSKPFPLVALALFCLGTLPTTLPAQAPSRTEINHFLESYMEAAVAPDPSQELRHYAGRVNYFGHGVVGAEFIARDQHRYYARWPVRTFTVLEGPNVLSVDEEGATISFRLRYDLTGPAGQVSGETTNTMVLRRIDGYLHIVGISEQKGGAAPVAAAAESRTTITREVEAQQPAPTPALAPAPKMVAEKKPAVKEHYIVGRTEPEAEKKPTAKADKPAAKTKPKPEPKPAPKVAEKKAPAPAPERESAPVTVGAGSSGSSLETAYAIPNVPGFVYPPGVERDPENMLDVRGMKSGQAAKDPRTGKQFLVP